MMAQLLLQVPLSAQRTLANLARVDEARSATQAGLTLDPSFTIRRFRAGAASDNPTYLTQRERIYEACERPGCPSGNARSQPSQRDQAGPNSDSKASSQCRSLGRAAHNSPSQHGVCGLSA